MRRIGFLAAAAFVGTALACAGGDAEEDPELVALRQRVDTLEALQRSLHADLLSHSHRSASRRQPPPSRVDWIRIDAPVLLRDRVVLEDIATAGRLTPHRDEDEVIDGYRISGVREGSPLDLLGFKNGDILHTIDGQPVHSLKGATEAWEAIQTVDRLDFGVTRRGEPLVVVVRVE